MHVKDHMCLQPDACVSRIKKPLPIIIAALEDDASTRLHAHGGSKGVILKRVRKSTDGRWGVSGNHGLHEVRLQRRGLLEFWETCTLPIDDIAISGSWCRTKCRRRFFSRSYLAVGRLFRNLYLG